MAMEEESNKLHVAMLPWSAFGHIIPFLELAKFIAQKGHKVTFISTPRNIDRLPEIPPNLTDSITLFKIRFHRVDGLPENAEATMDIRTDLEMSLLKKAYDGLQPELTRFLETALPDWFIHDFNPYWIQPIARNLGVKTAFFSIINAWTYGFFGPTEMLIEGTDDRSKAEDFLVPPKWVPFENKVAFKIHEANWTLGAIKENESGFSDTYRIGMISKNSDLIIFRHCYEFEGEWLKLLNELYPRPVIPAGLMPPQFSHNPIDDDKNEAWISIKQWLDGQNPGSVVYVALGSEVSPSQNDITKLALGLELSMVPFFWVLRNSSQSGYEPSDSLKLPHGFEERINGRGIVWKNWAPQLKILNHGAIGGFLTHCGWGSTIEGLMFGHPMIMLPFVVDQGLNARVLEDKQVGVEVPRNEQDGSYSRDSVAETVKLVMAEDEGKKFKEKAKEMEAIFGNRELHDAYLHKVVEYLQEYRHKSMD
ncbi:OLC1v1031584C1 [Oldenlandia corymbosa var. corymbosa]|uniref:Glycosyltransferase n=1 Tax=Oldenlandia corymbosa var. corymbosa TaxID=529605 RepID=A0AAV1CJP8_OLDCO|nr:OLC1v1031584C1 [Oldenlandia corymbosa var. corymbosa]